MAGVTPQQIYTALLAVGASTTQAIGIMANMMAESSLDPEEINRGDPNGGSFGLVQQNGGQNATLVTGNPQADMTAQIKVLAQNGGIQAASGSTPQQAAGNFSANYERCTTCQPGQGSYQVRVANASTVAGWVASGKWPTSAGSATAAAATGGSVSSATADPTCAWGLSGSVPGLSSLPLVGGAFQASICFIHKTTIRHAVGGLVLIVGGGAALVGSLILAASAFQRSGAGAAAGRGLETVGAGVAVIPGGEAAGLGIAATGAVARRAGTPSGASQSLQRRRTRRASERTSRASAAAQREAGERRAAERDRGIETVKVEERTPIEGEMGGTRREVRTLRRPGPRRAA